VLYGRNLKDGSQGRSWDSGDGNRDTGWERSDRDISGKRDDSGKRKDGDIRLPRKRGDRGTGGKNDRWEGFGNAGGDRRDGRRKG